MTKPKADDLILIEHQKLRDTFKLIFETACANCQAQMLITLCDSIPQTTKMERSPWPDKGNLINLLTPSQKKKANDS